MAQETPNHQQINNLVNTDYNYRKLKTQHKQVEQDIEEEKLHPGRTVGTVAQLKKLKLRIRDEMTMIERARLQQAH